MAILESDWNEADFGSILKVRLCSDASLSHEGGKTADMQTMRWLTALGALLSLPGVCRANEIQLASIIGLEVGPNEYVESFTIDTWGVTVVAVCHLPPGWTITAGRSAAQDGVIAGEGSHGVAFLDKAHLDQLHGLVLLRLDGTVQTSERRSPAGRQPATFSGHAGIGTYGSDRQRRLRMNHANVQLTPAAHCP